MTHTSRDWAPLLKELQQQGWITEETTKGHIKALDPSGEHIVLLSSTSSSPNAVQNAISDLKGRGFKWPPPLKVGTTLVRSQHKANRKYNVTVDEILELLRQGHTKTSAAKILKVPVGTIYNRLLKDRRHLRQGARISKADNPYGKYLPRGISFTLAARLNELAKVPKPFSVSNVARLFPPRPGRRNNSSAGWVIARLLKAKLITPHGDGHWVVSGQGKSLLEKIQDSFELLDANSEKIHETQPLVKSEHEEEFRAMEDVLEMLNTLNLDAKKRVLTWVSARLGFSS